jgi:hypothetical protein
MVKTAKRKHTKRTKKRAYKNKKTSKKRKTCKGGGPFDTDIRRKQRTTPYERPKCKYGSECTRKNPAHFAEFSHPPPCRDGIHCNNISDQHFKKFAHPSYTRYENQDQVKQFIQECYESYSRDPTDMFANFEYSSISFLKKGIDESNTLRKTFFFNLLAYIVCNICDIIAMPNGKDFISTMLQRFNEESIDGNFTVRDDELELQYCIQKLGIPYINCIAIVSVLQDQESEFNKNGCI